MRQAPLRPLLTRSELPIDPLLPVVIESIRNNSITLLQAEPGAGKTTRVPPALLDAGFKDVCVLEPRRLAARLAAHRVAQERGEPVGESVGYQVRFEQQSSARTRLWFLTEGILTRRFAADPQLGDFEVVVLDEFHERNLDTDLSLALLLRLQCIRPELKLLLMSATLGGESLSRHLGNAPLIHAPGRQFAINVRYTPATSAPLEAQATAALESCLFETDGHILIFLPGASEIRKAMDAAQGLAQRASALVLPLHGDLPASEQDRAVASSIRRKLIFSTNVAESSITIDGVRAVVDSGLARAASRSSWSGLGRLRIEKISRSSAIQRAGRAGRTAPGLAVRLYSEEDFRRRAEQGTPEIYRADLSQTLLQLAAMGIEWDELAWLENPPAEALAHARGLLIRLGAFDASLRLTSLGRRMAAVPLHPRLSRFVLEATRYGETKQAALIAAQLSEGRLRLDDRLRKQYASDIDVILAAEPSSNVRRVSRQVFQMASHERHRAHDVHALEKSLLVAYPDRVARRRGETLLLSSGGSARLDSLSASHSEFLLAIEVEERAEQGSPLVRIACPLEPDWLLDLFSDRVTTRDALEWNRTAERVDQVSNLVYDALVIDESRQPPTDGEATATLLVTKALEAGIHRFTDQDSLDRLLARAEFARQFSPSLNIPESIVESALGRLSAGLRSFAELAQAASNGGITAAIESVLPMARIDEIAPAHLRLPTGRRASIEYSAHQNPWVASRLQDFFGMRETPRVASGSVPLVLHLLAPNRRPVQMTQDLASFWDNLYPQVRRELSRRYPRHKWPENPYNPQ
jgi:ATP-dependent helicase HrpB